MKTELPGWCLRFWGVLLLAACASDVAEEARYACRVDRDCREGWYCVARACQAMPGPDGGRLDGGSVDQGSVDAGAGGEAGRMADAVVGGAGGEAGSMADAVVGGSGGEAGSMADAGVAGGGGGLEDADGDGVPDDQDNCPAEPNPGQEDANRNRVGDVCEACDTDTQCSFDVRSDCDVDGACGGRYDLIRKEGLCTDRVCGTYSNVFTAPACAPGTRCVQVEETRAECQPDPACAEVGDQDGDGIPDDEDNCPNLVNPFQENTDGDAFGNLCEPCADDRECFVPGRGAGDVAEVTQCQARESLCEGLYIRSGDDGICSEGTCTGFDGSFDNHLIPCPAGTRCENIDGQAVCVVDPMCPPACTLQTEGQSCGPVEGDARCVGGVCRQWRCTDVWCNENGPRLGSNFGRFGAAMSGNNMFFDARIDATFLWNDDPVRDLDEAHRQCEETVRARLGQTWRLPTIHELIRIARRNANDLAAFQAIGWVAAGNVVTLSRTVVDANNVMGVRLATGEVVIVPQSNPGAPAAPYSAVCILSEDRVEDLSELRLAWQADGFVTDPWSGLTWGPIERGNLSHVQAAMSCMVQGKVLAKVDMLYSLLTFNVAAPPGPGFWPSWDGLAVGRERTVVWAGDMAEPFEGMNQAWTVDLATGVVQKRGVGVPLPFICVEVGEPN